MFWKKTASKSASDLSAVTAFAAVGAGIGSVFIGRKLGYVKADEVTSMVIVGVIAGFGAILLEFVFRLLFISPSKIHEEHAGENRRLQLEIAKLRKGEKSKNLEIEWEQIDLGTQSLVGPNLRFDLINTGEISLDDVGVLINQIDSEDRFDKEEAPAFPISLIPGANKRRLNPQDRLTVAFGAVVISDPSFPTRKGPYAILRLASFSGGISNSYFSFHVEDKYKIRITPTAKDTKIPALEFYVSSEWTGPDSDYYQFRITKA